MLLIIKVSHYIPLCTKRVYCLWDRFIRYLEYDLLWLIKVMETAIPSGWLIALPYLRNNAHVRLIVPSKMGHTTAQQYVNPYFYDIWKFEKAKS